MSDLSNYIIGGNNNIFSAEGAVKAFDNITYQQYESSNPLRLKYHDKDTFENKNVEKTVDTAQNMGAEIYSVYSNPFYIFHKIVQLGKLMLKQYNKIVAYTIVNHQIGQDKAASNSIKENLSVEENTPVG